VREAAGGERLLGMDSVQKPRHDLQPPADEPSFVAVFRALRRHFLVILICVVAVPAVAYFYSDRQVREYEATAQILFRQTSLQSVGIPGGSIYQASPDVSRQAATNLGLVSLPVVSARTARRLGLPVSAVEGHVEVEPEGESDLVNIVGRDRSATRSALLANRFAEEFIAMRRSQDRREVAQAREVVMAKLRKLPNTLANAQRRLSLSIQADQLATLLALQSGPAKLVQRASVPPSPASPKPVRDALLGLGLGAVLGIALALLLSRLDRRVRTPQDVAAVFSGPTVGVIPRSKSLKPSAFRRQGLRQVDADAFEMLRANLRYFNIDATPMRSLMVTSAQPGEGKTTVAMHLAAVAAAGGDRVLLVEADLRRPSIAKSVGAPEGDGLSEVLSGQAEMAKVLRRLPAAVGHAGETTLDVLLAGRQPPNPGRLLASERMKELVKQAEQSYDFVVIDTPPISAVADAFPLIGWVGGVIAVCRLSATSHDALVHLDRQLEHLGAPTLGLVLNDVRAADRRSGYGYYGYGYGYSSGAPSPEPVAYAPPANGHVDPGVRDGISAEELSGTGGRPTTPT
jgi:capsular exopolysaccharide synthesis family protein